MDRCASCRRQGWAHRPCAMPDFPQLRFSARAGRSVHSSASRRAGKLSVPLGTDSTAARGLNNSGQALLSSGLYSNGTFTPFPAGFTGFAINANGHVAGTMPPAISHSTAAGRHRSGRATGTAATVWGSAKRVRLDRAINASETSSARPSMTTNLTRASCTAAACSLDPADPQHRGAKRKPTVSTTAG